MRFDGTLYFFDISHNTSKNVYESAGSRCSTEYYDSNKHYCGSSMTREINKDYVTHSYSHGYGHGFTYNMSTPVCTTTTVKNRSWETTYYGSSSSPIGYSETKQQRDGSFETTYKDTSGKYRGLSVSSMQRDKFCNEIIYTAYYYPGYYRGKECCGSSTRRDHYADYNIPTIQQMIEREAQRQAKEKAQREAKARTQRTQNERDKIQHEALIRYYLERPEREARERDENERKKAARKDTLAANIQRSKEYYLIHAGFFNASSRVFEGNDPAEILEKLENRASLNPDGASDRTLRQLDMWRHASSHI